VSQKLVVSQLAIIRLNQFGSRINLNQFRRVNRIEFPSSLFCLAVCKAGASSVCLLVTELVIIALYYKFKQFTNILVHILVNIYVTFRVASS